MAKTGDKLVCELCGKEVVIDACGCSETVLWCCNQPMKSKSKSRAKKRKSK